MRFGIVEIALLFLVVAHKFLPKRDGITYRISLVLSLPDQVGTKEGFKNLF